MLSRQKGLTPWGYHRGYALEWFLRKMQFSYKDCINVPVFGYFRSQYLSTPDFMLVSNSDGSRQSMLRCRSSFPKKTSMAVPLQDNPVRFHPFLLCRLANFLNIFLSSLFSLAILTNLLGFPLSGLYQLQINL